MKCTNLLKKKHHTQNVLLDILKFLREALHARQAGFDMLSHITHTGNICKR